MIHTLPKGIIPSFIYIMGLHGRDVATAKAATAPFHRKTSQLRPVFVIPGETNLPAGFHLPSCPASNWRRNDRLPTAAQQLEGGWG